ncbi:MAG: GNAT family N-acetyltransferase [bacterium]|nr:GNAT family N-acetyltransferase [bacterium]
MMLKSKRIYLRPPRRSDANALFDAIAASRKELDQFLLWPPHTTKVKHSSEFIRRTFVWRRREMAYAFSVFDSATDEYLGNCGLHDVRQRIRSAEIGYWIRSDHAGKGLTTEAAALLLRFAFEGLRLHRIVLRAATDNAASIRVAEKLGFQFDGIHRHEDLLARGWIDYKYFCMIEDEYRAAKDKLTALITK